ncbi:MAG TPA: DUF933 domain-containing protein [bacterium]|nr:DUF933 domain-containing protein [bacterium]HNS48751.1 DUF933 domain-containing protein [bacterium]
MKTAIFGFSGAGKTALSARLAGKRVESFDPYQPAALAVKLADRRLARLREIVKPAKLTPPEVLLLDFKGPARAAGIEEKVLAGLLEADVIILVLDGFSAGANPAADLESLLLEFVFRDADRVASIIERRRTEQAAGRRRANPVEDEALKRAAEHLAGERPLYRLERGPADAAFLAALGLISDRKFFLLLNGPSADPALAGAAERLQLDAFRLDLAGDGPPDEAVAEFWATFLDRVGLITFYTAGEKETRAWLLPRGATALAAAGQIHTDIARGFIRAEVVNFTEFDRLGGYGACRQHGALRLEGKEYPVVDGDLLHIRCST